MPVLFARHAINPRTAAMMRDAFPHRIHWRMPTVFSGMATGPAPNLLLVIEVMGERQAALASIPWLMRSEDLPRSGTGFRTPSGERES